MARHFTDFESLKAADRGDADLEEISRSAALKAGRKSVLVVVGFQLVPRMVMFMGAVVAGVVMIVHVVGPVVGVFVQMLMQMLVGVAMGVFVRMLLSVMGMLVGMRVAMIMGMQVLMFVFSFHVIPPLSFGLTLHLI